MRFYVYQFEHAGFVIGGTALAKTAKDNQICKNDISKERIIQPLVHAIKHRSQGVFILPNYKVMKLIFKIKYIECWLGTVIQVTVWIV